MFTLFNAIVAAGFVLLLALGQWRDALFGLSAVGNAVIGVAQEYRAKRALDRLAVVVSRRARVLREGTESEVDVADVVLGDLLVLAAGDQVPADGIVLEEAGLEVDESLLTGEAEPVGKGSGSEVLSGSIVLAGTGLIRASRVGSASFAGSITVEAKRFVLVSSELRQGLDRVLLWITWAIGPVLLLVVNAQMQTAGGWAAAIATGSWRTGAVGVIASAIAMIPLALVLLTSLAFAVGAARLARQGVLMQELAAVEGLARVDTLCVDKTGTLTRGSMSFEAVHGTGWDAPGWREALGWFASQPDANATARALLAPFPAAAAAPVATVPFDSDRKWSAVQFERFDGGQQTWVLGAPDVVLGHEAADVLELADELAANGRRAVVLAATAAPLAPSVVGLPPNLRPAALLTFREEVRPDARRTLEYFREQGVRVLVLSGDDPRTVGAVAREVGLDTGDGVDARRLPEEPDELGRLLASRSVFGRITPAQKRRIILTLQSQGRVVAMTGDGVNDVPALKVADLGIAMNSATAATKAVARLVLLDGRFDRLPKVVAEGRRVIANVERVSMLFLAKTCYAMLLSVVFGTLVWAFPFLPRQLSVSDGITIGIPAFLLALMPNARAYRRGFLLRSLTFAVPAGGIVAAAVTAVHLAGSAAQPDELRTTALVVLCLAGLWILVVVSRPFDLPRLLTVALMYAALGGVLALPAALEFLRLRWPQPPLLGTALAATLGAMVAIEVLARFHRRWTDRTRV